MIVCLKCPISFQIFSSLKSIFNSANIQKFDFNSSFYFFTFSDKNEFQKNLQIFNFIKEKTKILFYCDKKFMKNEKSKNFSENYKIMNLIDLINQENCFNEFLRNISFKNRENELFESLLENTEEIYKILLN